MSKGHFFKRSDVNRTFIWIHLMISLILGCDETSNILGIGSLEVRIAAEDVITEGLQPGDGASEIQDGWSVRFNRYLVTIGEIDLHASNGAKPSVQNRDVYVVDLTKIPSSGLALWSFEELAQGRWEFSYQTASHDKTLQRHESVTQEDYDQVKAEEWTYYIDGVIEQEDGQSCPPLALVDPGDRTPNGSKSGENDCYDVSEIRFSFGADADTLFGPCEIDGVTGVAITANVKQTASITIHGDHLFFNGFPEGAEGGVKRLVQWLADCDLNLDGLVTQAELEAITPAQLPELDDRFQLGGSPITPLQNMYTYVQAQLKTQGHFQGEGECPIDGLEHDH